MKRKLLILFLISMFVAILSIVCSQLFLSLVWLFSLIKVIASIFATASLTAMIVLFLK